VVEPGSERDFEGELRRLRESLEAQVRAAEAEAEKQRRRAEEARAVTASDEHLWNIGTVLSSIRSIRSIQHYSSYSYIFLVYR
jgi:hypothetical protein